MKVVVVGAGIAGLTTALALGRRGHEVILCERDATSAPAATEEMWTAWPRPGTPQAPLGHLFLPRFCREMRRHAPDVLHRALAAGALAHSFADAVPGGERLPEDEDLEGLFCRRAVMEGVLRQTVEAQPGVEVRAGCAVAGLLAGPAEYDSLPRVVGVRTREGTELRADAVVLAGGRLLPLARWLGEIGAAAPEEIVEDCGLVYYCRYFRVLPTVEDPTGGAPRVIGFDLGYLGAAVVAGDNGTFYAVLMPGSWDSALRVLHEEEAFMAALRSMPAVAPWVAPERAVPIGPVEAMGRLNNMLRTFTPGGRPLALGLFVLGDARCHTNPTVGWGSALGAGQAFALAEVLTAGARDPLAQALAFEQHVAGELVGWHRLIGQIDRARTLRWHGGQDMAPPAHPDDDREAFVWKVVLPAAGEDPAIFRAVHRWLSLLDPPDALTGNTAVLEKAAELAARRAPPAEPPAAQGPTRDTLLSLLGGGHPVAVGS